MKDSQPIGWTIHDAKKLYQVNRWSDGFFSVNQSGNIEVYPTRDPNAPIDLFKLIQQIEQSGTETPALVRFPQIAQTRFRDLYAAFSNSINEYLYDGCYRCIYPIKVSPHRQVIQSLCQSDNHQGEPPIGLEAGSKSELLAVVASASNRTPILCNGFKDESYIEMALHAVQLGRHVTIIIEKPNEIELVGRKVQEMGVRPRLGVRMKLASRGAGHWESTGGTKSKFGLTVSELLDGLDRLSDWSLRNSVEVLHFHLGSQITQIRYLKNAVIEATRIYASLIEQQVPLKIIDVGGGLGIDYCGQRESHTSSINYTWQEYANDVVFHIQSVCDQSNVPHPNIYSESGRAVVAHHSLMVIPVRQDAANDRDTTPRADVESADKSCLPVRYLTDTLDELTTRNLLESYHDAEQAMDMAVNLFRHGHLSIQQRSDAERLFQVVCRAICNQLSELDFVPSELAALEELLARNEIVNFSVFRSLPDHWAIEQLFPILPVHRLDERPQHHAVLSDITCDSDGMLKRFVSSKGESTSLRLHELDGKPYYLGAFLVGAYQEILGDAHNLFGRLNVIEVVRSPNETMTRTIQGDTIGNILSSVEYEPSELVQQIRNALTMQVEQQQLTNQQANEVQSFFESIVDSSTYLTNGDSRPTQTTFRPHFRKAEETVQ